MIKKNDLEDLVETAEEVVGEESAEPASTNQDWSEYVLDTLKDHELKDGNPTVDGLRRATEAVFGEIVRSTSEIHNYDHARGVCTIKHTLEIRKYETDTIIVVDGCVDVNRGNIPHPFNQHLVATADTRAEGKALRRALKLRVVTAEEMQNSDEDDTLASQEVITDQQILAINQMCKRLDVDLVSLGKTSCPNIEDIRSISNLQGRMLLSSLSEYQRKPSSIPESLVGYKSNWRENFDSGGK